MGEGRNLGKQRENDRDNLARVGLNNKAGDAADAHDDATAAYDDVDADGVEDVDDAQGGQDDVAYARANARCFVAQYGLGLLFSCCQT